MEREVWVAGIALSQKWVWSREGDRARSGNRLLGQSPALFTEERSVVAGSALFLAQRSHSAPVTTTYSTEPHSQSLPLVPLLVGCRAFSNTLIFCGYSIYSLRLIVCAPIFYNSKETFSWLISSVTYLTLNCRIRTVRTVLFDLTSRYYSITTLSCHQRRKRGVLLHKVVPPRRRHHLRLRSRHRLRPVRDFTS